MSAAKTEVSQEVYRAALEKAIAARADAETACESVRDHGGALADRLTHAERHAARLKAAALEAAIDEAKFKTAVKLATEAEDAAEFLRLAIARHDAETAPAAHRALLAARLAELQAREALQMNIISAFEDEAKAALQRTAEVLGEFTIDGLGDHHESLLDQLDDIRRDLRQMKAEIKATDEGETK